MKFATLLDIYKMNQNNPLFNVPVEKFPFMAEYLENYFNFDFSVIQKFSSYVYSYEPLVILDIENEPLDNFKQSFLSYLSSHKETYNRIYSALMAEYNPLENYNGQSVFTVEETGKENNKNTKTGKIITDNTLSGTKATARQDTPTSGNYIDTETNLVSSEGNETYTNQNRTVKEIAKRGETITDSFNNFHDKTETSYSNDYADNSEKSFENRKTTTTENKHGNLGVTTSQQMVESEILLRLKYQFYELLFSDFIKQYCIV